MKYKILEIEQRKGLFSCLYINKYKVTVELEDKSIVTVLVWAGDPENKATLITDVESTLKKTMRRKTVYLSPKDAEGHEGVVSLE